MADNRNFVNKFANQGGGDIFVEDAKLSEISTKSAIASEGVMLKGTDGAYYEIDKTSLSEVIRAELGAILADNSKNNGTSVDKVPTLNSSGNALGSSSVADLASVLGVGQKHNIGSAEWLSITIDQSFGCIYLLGVDPSTGAFEAKIIMARDYNGDPHISGIQAHIQIKKKNNTYYFKTPPGYEARLVEITNKNCTVTTTTNVPSDATDVEINNQK